MFDNLSDRLNSIFDGLKRRGALKESDVTAALREVRVALLEADVALPVVKSFIDKVKVKAVGQEVLKSVTPGQQVIKIVNDELVAMLGSEASGINTAGVPPVAILMVGLQGSGKTTTTAKLAKRLTEKEKKKVLMASLDVRRPAAQEQLKVLGEQIGVKTLPIIAGQMPVDIAKRAMDAAKLQGFDVVMLDTAGRLHVDQSLMAEVIAVRDTTMPLETLLVADSLTGQDAVNVAKEFDAQVGITGVALTRMDGDGRGGAALSMRSVTGKPIKLAGTGEKMDALEDFHPERVASRILGMGDVVSLVEKAAETIEQEEAEKMAKKMAKGEFDLDDLRSQLQQMSKMGGMKGVLGLLPGVGKIKQAMNQSNMDDKIFKRQEAIISSMTPKERKQPKMINASRKKRIAAGSGTSVPEVNKLLKMHMQMAKMMKKMSQMGKKGKMPGLPGMGGMPGGLPPGFDKLM
ncbi:signal recognition particle protein [Kordiimonas sp. SCSIO 12610]|uniref:signal recognition particle protein n=1 Tax=Kordiimonas sp. SCSIO 12610 TaxID=2829597 RepID=UPI00210AE0F0|nr:signal recognition particle protein [Kordiimonas sp. SCSIO 12610]UTW55055.1 signal recognition particle protein [Kordiimonas sp. SCSIO 12610]